jgi:hypothetical protein
MCRYGICNLQSAMDRDSYDILRRALVEALGPRPTPERRRRVAADLRALAEQQERMAERDTERASQPPGIADGTGKTPPRAAGFYVRIKHEQDPHINVIRIRVSLGHAAWAAIGNPDRIDIQRVGPNIWIVPANGPAGHRLDTGAGLASCLVDMAGPLGQVLPGRYAAMLHAGAIVIGERLA